MDKRELKEQCYIEALEDTLIGVEMILNRINQIKRGSDVIDENVLMHDLLKTTLDLELSLASLCIMLRKMSENLFVTLPQDLRRDINSLIHSNRFEYENNALSAYSQKGKEDINLNNLLNFTRNLINDKK
jgi:arylsulfatase A-like enzyme